MPIKITYQGNESVVDDGSTAVIGSDAASTIRIVRPGISRQHAVVSQTPSGWTIEDAGSRNGSYRFGQRFDAIAINSPETVYLGHPTDGERIELAPVVASEGLPVADPPVIDTFVLPENSPPKAVATAKAASAAPADTAAPTGKPTPPSRAKPPASDPTVPPAPAVTPEAAAARTRAQRTPREVDLAELTNALRDQINAVKGLTWSVWAMIAVTAALAVMTLFVGILGS